MAHTDQLNTGLARTSTARSESCGAAFFADQKNKGSFLIPPAPAEWDEIMRAARENTIQLLGREKA